MKVFISSTIALAALAAAPTQAELPASVTALLDTSVSPCDDFYQYSCGGWLKANELGPSDTSKDYSFSNVADRNELVIQDIVKEDWPLVGEFWDSCLDTDTLTTLGNKPLQPVLKKIAGAADKAEAFKVAGELSRIGASLVTSIDIAGDYKDAKTNAVYVGNSELTLPDINYYLDKDTFEYLEPLYRTYISTVMKASGYQAGGSGQGQSGKPASSKFFEDAVISVEKTLANIQNRIEEQEGEDAYYNPISLGEAMEKYPLTIGAYFSGVDILGKSSLTKDSKVIFSFFDYFEKVEKALESIETKDLKAYIAFQYVNNRVRHLDGEFYTAYFEFFAKTLSGQQAPSPRPSICTYRMQQFFPDLIGKYYFMKMFDKQREDSAQLMTKLIEEAMGEHINKLDWLDNATRLEAAGKLAKVANLIGQSSVKRSYPFVLSRTEFFNNINSILTNDFEEKMKKAGNPVNRALWSISPAEVNAYYSPLENKMVFPAAILQPPFFNGTAHPAQNFGSIGAVIGHELTHGFDSSGRQFDGFGNKRNWWTQTTGDEFKKRAKCLEDQYSGFSVTGEQGTSIGYVNGNLTIGENTADNGGFSLSWDAYQNYIKTASAEEKGSVTEAEGNQLMFLAFAQTWCGKSRDGAMQQQITTDPHSPGEWRANGVAMNSKHFADTFQCKAGDKMNPSTKCELW